MKKLLSSFLILSGIFVSGWTTAQTLNITGLTSQQGAIFLCDSTLSFSISAMQPAANSNADIDLVIQSGAFASATLSASVNWGDGTVTNHTGIVTAPGQVISWSGPQMEHYYTSGGTFYPVVQITNPQDGSVGVYTSIVNVSSCYTQLYTFVSLDCNADGQVDTTFSSGVPVTLTGSNANYGEWQNNGLTEFYGVGAGTYQIGVEQWWLNNNNYVINSITPSTIQIQDTMTILTTMILLNCDSNVVQNSNCFFGYTFCDADSNGVLGSNEILIPNAPITLMYNGQTMNITSDANGYFFAQINAPANTPVMVSLNPNWLAQNGYSWGNNFYTYLLQPCNVYDTVFVGLNCSGGNPTNCFFGYTFCDADSNGVLGSNEILIPNAPITLMYNGQTINITSDANGYFFAQINASANTPVMVSLNPNWLAQNGYSWGNNFYTYLLQPCNVYDTVFIGLDCGGGSSQGCVTGYVWCDANNNGYFDNNEQPLTGAPVQLFTTPTTTTVFTDSSGQFTYCGPVTSGYIVGMIDTSWLSLVGASSNNPIYTFPVYNFPAGANYGFGVNCGGSNTCANLWTEVTPWIGYYQNYTNQIKLRFGNYGPDAPGAYTVTLNFPAGVTPVTGSINIPGYSIVGNSIIWNLYSASTNFVQTDIIYFTVPAGVANGTDHYYTSVIATAGNVADCGLYNNDFTLLQTVGNSYDPNDKNVNQPEVLSPQTDDKLIYTIRFQNTGTAPAQDIYILDTLSANLDWSTLQVLNTTHEMYLVDLGNGVMRFDFPQIWLPDSNTNEALSHGSVTYEIRENAGNASGTEIKNTAYIYFDANPAIVTGTTYNINGYLGLEETDLSAVEVYPNPASEEVYIRAGKNIESAVLYDLSGKILNVWNGSGTVASLDVRGLNAGVYLLTIAVDGTKATHKVVVE